MRVVWRSAGMRPGALCAMDYGQPLMHKWLADSWDTHFQVTVIDVTITACMDVFQQSNMLTYYEFVV